MELHRMNTTDTADAALVGAHHIRIISGVRKTPPPVPVKPASSPSTAPIITAAHRAGGVV